MIWARDYNISSPKTLIAGIARDNRASYAAFRRRVVVGIRDEKPYVVASAVSPLDTDGDVQAQPTRQYPNALLFEDTIDLASCLDFVQDVDDGLIHIGDLEIASSRDHRQWAKEWVPTQNNYMVGAGHVISTQFSEDGRTITDSPLLAPRQAYYPDLAEAVRDWLLFPQYHGRSDARNGEVIFLLPETRAYLADAFPTKDLLTVTIAGSLVGQRELVLNGAWWENGEMRHFEEAT